MVLPVTSGLVLHLEANSGVTTNGTTVLGWADASGLGNDLTALGNPQLAGGQTPTGEAAILFDGTGDLLERVDPITGLPMGSADRTVFVVIDYDDTSSAWSGFAYGDDEANETFGVVANPAGNLAIQGFGRNNDFASTTNGIAGDFQVQSVVLRDDFSTHYRNGVIIDQDAHTFATDVQRIALGTEIGDRGQLEGRVAAVLVYDRALDTGERDEVEQYLDETYLGDVIPNPPAGALSLEGFENNLVLDRSDLQGGSSFFLPISMTFLPDNRMLLLSKDGEIRIVDPESGNNSIYMTINNIDTGQERGLLDITLDPNFEQNGYFYLYYTPNNPENARIARFEHNENSGGLNSRGSLSSETVIWEDNDGYLACCHYGGGLDFGPDGKLWLTTADKFQATTPGEGSSGGVDIMLDLERSSGKIIRVNKDGTIPDGTDGTPANPFIDGPGGNDDSIWAYGLRNPFRAEWDEEYGYFYIGEVGGNQQLLAHDDLHLASLDQPGAFYGWPFYEGTPNTFTNAGESSFDPADFPAPDNDLADPANGDLYSAPIWSFEHASVPEIGNQSASLTGGEVYRGNMFPEEWDGVYFYGDYTRDYIRYIILDETGTQELGDFAFKPSTQLPGATNEVVSINVGNDGALYYALISSGEVFRITHNGAGGNAAPEIVSSGVTPLSGDLPLLVTFNAQVTDPDGDPITYIVNFGDGSAPATGTVAPNGSISETHTYTTDGRFDVTLSVSDGDLTTFGQTIEVEAGDPNEAPVLADVTSDLTFVEANEDEVTFSARATDADGDTMTFVWDFGDGSTPVTGTVPPDGIVVATHTYTSEGGFDAFLEVSDGTDTTTSVDVPIQVGTPTEVPVTNGLVLLLEADIKIGLEAPGSDTVVAWLDGSGNGNNLFGQGDPQLVDGATPSGKPAIVFDGTGDLLDRVDAQNTLFRMPSGNADRTMFVVVDYVDPNNVFAGVSYGDNAPNEGFGLVATKDGNLAVQGYGSANDFDAGVNGTNGGFFVQSVVLDDDVTSHYRDGVLIDSDAHNFNTDPQRLVIGGELGDLGQSEVSVAAVLMFDRALNTAERELVELFLQDKYLSTGPNTAPSIGSTGPFTVAENTVFVTDVQSTDDSDTEGNGLTYSISGGADASAFTIDAASGDLTFVVAPDFEAPTDSNGDNTYEVAVTVTDSGSLDDTVTFEVNVTDRDEGGGSTDVPVTAGLVGAYSADENVSLGVGNRVVGWLDGSGVGNDLLSQGDPRLVQNATPSGLEAIVFDGTGDLLERSVAAGNSLTGLSSGNADRTMFLVVDYVDPNNVFGGVSYGDNAPNEAFGLVATRDGNLAVQGYGSANDFDAGVNGTNGGFFVQSVVLDDNVTSHYRDGTLIDSDAHNFNTDLQRLVIGGELGDLGQVEMSVASVLIYDRALTEVERQQVETFLQAKYLGSTPAGRVTADLLALYTFDAGSGSTVFDTSGVGTPLNLTIADPGNVTWGQGTLTIDSSTVIASTGAASKLNDAIPASGALTVEAWIDPDGVDQTGPARIVTLSGSSSTRNVTLGQGKAAAGTGDSIDVRLRTTTTSDNGTPSVNVDGLTDDLVHVVYTRGAGGAVSIYYDGVEVASDTVGGNLSTWDDAFAFALGNELTGGRPWLGTFDLVAIYDDALTASEVLQNFNAGNDNGSGNGTSNTPPVIAAQGFDYDENQIGTVGTVVASDADGDTLSYDITGGNAGGLFAINQASGVLSVTSPLDFETQSSHALTVSVNDGTATSSATVTVTVGDVDEGTPTTPPAGSVVLLDPVGSQTGLPDSSQINTAPFYLTKTQGLSFRTGTDVDTAQVIYEQGGLTRGLNLFIEDGNLYAAAWNKREENWGYREVATTTDLAADTEYTATVVFDGTSSSNGTLSLHLESAGDSETVTIGGIGRLYAHGDDTGIGQIAQTTLVRGQAVNEADTPSADFGGSVVKLVQYNDALSGGDLTQLQTYLADDWLNGQPPANTPQPPAGAAVLLDPVGSQDTLPDSAAINLSDQLEKTHGMAFRANDVQSTQVLYEQGGLTRGFNLFIENGNLHAAAWNKSNGNDWGYQEVSTPISAGTDYTTVLEIDGTATDTGTLALYLNGALVAAQNTGIGQLDAHADDIGIGQVAQNTLINDTQTTSADFNGEIDKLVQYNDALSDDAALLNQLNAYLADDWLV